MWVSCLRCAPQLGLWQTESASCLCHIALRLYFNGLIHQHCLHHGMPGQFPKSAQVRTLCSTLHQCYCAWLSHHRALTDARRQP